MVPLSLMHVGQFGARNEIVFNEKKPSPISTIVIARSQSFEYLKGQSKEFRLRQSG